MAGRSGGGLMAGDVAGTAGVRAWTCIDRGRAVDFDDDVGDEAESRRAELGPEPVNGSGAGGNAFASVGAVGGASGKLGCG